MRKKHIRHKAVLGVSLLLLTSILSACGNNEIINTDSSEDTSPVNSEQTEEASSNATTETVIEEEPIDMRTVTISEWGYDNRLEYISQNYYMTEIDDLYYLIDQNGDIVADDQLPEGLGNGWDYVNTNQQDGTFIVRKTQDDGYYITGLLERDLNPLYLEGVNNPNLLYLTDYRDNLLFAEEDKLENNSVNTQERIRFTGTLPSQFASYGEYENHINILNSSYNKVIFGFSFFNINQSLFSFTEDSQSVINELENNPDNVFDKTHIEPLVKGDEYINIMPNLPNKNGWITAVKLVNVIVSNDNQLQYDSTAFGFYNVNTGEFVALPEEVSSTTYYVEDNGCDICTAINNRSAVYIGEDSNGNSLKRIFDLTTGDYASNETYLYAEVGYHDLLLVENTDEKWGYIHEDDLTQASEWFDDATSFCNGYAVVIQDGKGHLINEDLETVSEEFDAEASYVATRDYLTFSDLNGRSVFFVQRDGQYHLLTVE
ncbi:MAG: hypothetical protein IJ232_00750 [Lachnospiraceae bacterium]|nr:hypothetical protein [Lachnospiraceae bacterium]